MTAGWTEDSVLALRSEPRSVAFSGAMDALGVEDFEVQAAAREVLRALDPLDELVAALDDRPTEALRAIGALREARLGGHVCALVRNSHDAEVRATAALTLALVDSPEREEVLLAALRDASPGVRIGAVSALDSVGSRNALASLKALWARESDPGVQVFIVDVLDNHGVL